MALEFQIDLTGNFAAGLDKGNKKLEETGEHAEHAKKKFELFETELGKVQAGALGLNFDALEKGGHFFKFDVAEGAALAFEAIMKVGEALYEAGEKAIDFGKEIIRAAGNAEDLNLAVKLDVGDEGAEKIEKIAESYKGTRFSPEQIKAAFLPLLEQTGTKLEEDWGVIISAATDRATKLKTGAGGVSAALEHFKDIALNPQRLRGSLKGLGIEQAPFYAELGKAIGSSAKDAEAQTKAGKIAAQDLVRVALRQMAEKQGGSVGNQTNAGDKTLGTQLARLDNLKDNLFVGLANSPGMAAVNGFLKNFVDVMEGDIGTDLIKKVGGAFETMFGDMSGPEGLEKMKTGIGSLATKVGNFIEDFRAAWPSIKEGAATVWEVLKGIGSALAWIAHGLKVSFTSAMYLAETLNMNHSKGWSFAGGGEPRDKETPDNRPMAQQLLEQALPKFADGGVVDEPTVALVGEAGPEMIVPMNNHRSLDDLVGASSGPVGGASNSVTMGDLNFQFAGNVDDDTKDDIAQMVQLEVKRLLDEAVANMGG